MVYVYDLCMSDRKDENKTRHKKTVVVGLCQERVDDKLKPLALHYHRSDSSEDSASVEMPSERDISFE